ncbi:MAG: DUF5060 domain-containing protein [Cohnella sp.]|nr:DUF5060 domain-containing protein [Cohnella sp.]
MLNKWRQLHRTTRSVTLAATAVIIIGIGTLAWALATDGVNDGKPTKAAAIPLEDADGDAGPTIVSTAAAATEVGLYEKYELTLELGTAYDNPYDPDEVDLSAVFLSPGGKEWRVNGFYDGYRWKVRFAANEVGKWSYRVALKDKTGTTNGEQGNFNAVASSRKGWVHVSAQNKRFFAHDDGSSFFGVGMAYPWGVNASGLDRIKANGGNLITYWNGNYDTGGGKNQLESLDSGIGRYDVYKGERVDEIVSMLEEREMKMNFAIWPHDSLADELQGWPATWDKSAYSVLGPAKDFYSSEEMWKYQEKLYRYIIARWGYSEAIGTWDIVVEISGTDGWALGDQKAANAWIRKVHDYFKKNDPYNHPTNGSRAGNEDDYWAEGYETLDVSDRENYYGLTAKEYARDIQMRWPRYEKPLVIGETGNVPDAIVYHEAIWSSVSNGLASAPVWWDITKMNDEMYAHMKSLSSFVNRIDFNEARTPATLTSQLTKQELNKEQPLAAGQTAEEWTQQDWADANVDENGNPYKVIKEGDGFSTNLWFRTGQFSQGAVASFFSKSDWSAYDRLQVDVYIEQDPSDQAAVQVRPVLFPGGAWDEGNDASDMPLKSGEWVTLTIPLRGAAADYWRNKPIAEDDLKAIQGWGLKLFTTASQASAKPAVVKFKNARLIAEQAPTIDVPSAEGWAMKGDNASYGWMRAGAGSIDGKSATLEGFGAGQVTISWFDPWQGTFLQDTTAEASGDRLTLTAPATGKKDIGFIIRRT